MKTNDDHQVDDLYMCKQSNTRLSSVAPRPLKSALRSSVAVGSNARKKGLPWKLAGRPRVHGLWSEDKATNPFALLHDSLLLEILASFLNLEDLCRCQGVSQRFATLSQRDEAWQRIDATSFVQSLYHFFKRKHHGNPAEATADLLVKKWQTKVPVSIRIDRIGQCLDAHSFSLPSNTTRLQSLRLSNFENLTDTHVHVLLLSAKTTPCALHHPAAPGPTSQNLKRINRRSTMTQPWPLRNLVLEKCPRMTNASLRSIASMCHQLQELDVSGCPLVNDLSPLQSLWKLQRRSSDVVSSSCLKSTLSQRSMSALLCDVATTSANSSPAPNVQATAHLGSLFLPPPPPSSSMSLLAKGTTGVLGTLFNPPPAQSATSATLPQVANENGLGRLSVYPPAAGSRVNALNAASPLLGRLLLPPTTTKHEAPLTSLFAPPSKGSASLSMKSVQSSLGDSLASLGAIQNTAIAPGADHSGESKNAMVSHSSLSLKSLDLLRQPPTVKLGRELCRIHFNNTGVTPDSVIRCFIETEALAGGNSVFALEALRGMVVCSGGQPSVAWNDYHLRALSHLIDSSSLRCLDISCVVDSAPGTKNAAGLVTDASILSLFGIHHYAENNLIAPSTAPMIDLHDLCITGHPFITQAALERLQKASISHSLMVRR